MTDNVPLATALIFVSVAVGAGAICYRLLYSRKPNQTEPALTSYMPPPIAPGYPVPPYTTPTVQQTSYAAAPPATKKARSWSENNWTISDEQSARKVARQGMWAAFFVAIVTGGASFLAGAGVPLFTGVGATAWVDAVIFAGLGVGIWRMSRVAAVAALLLYIAERIALAPTVGLSPVMLIAMVSCFVQGVRGTWAFHRFRQQSK
jgi:hypothetical protein